jgi:hypothetical protein
MELLETNWRERVRPSQNLPMYRICVRLAAAVFLFAALMTAADLSGVWRGAIDIEHGDGGDPIKTPVQLRLEQKGNALAGEIGREGDEKPLAIQKGRVEGNEVFFEASSEQTKGPIRFHLKLGGSRLTGEMTGTIEHGNISGRVNLVRGSE